jgi:hypothetical protein
MLMEYLTIFHLPCVRLSACMKVDIRGTKTRACDMNVDRSGLFFCADDGETEAIISLVVVGVEGFEIGLIAVVHAGEIGRTSDRHPEIVIGVGNEITRRVGDADRHKGQIGAIGEKLLSVGFEPDDSGPTGGMNSLGNDSCAILCGDSF